MAVPRIVQIANPLDGTSVILTLAAAPTGTPHFYVSRIPGAPGEPALEQMVEAIFDPYPNNGYRVYVPWPVDAQSAPEVFHFLVKDDAGWSVSRDVNGYLQGIKAAWVGHNESDEVCDIMRQLLWRVIDNRDAINARLQQIEPDCTLQQVMWGMGLKLTAYPCIEINLVQHSEPYEVAPMGRLARVRADLYGYIVHQRETVQAELCAAFGRALQRVLNQEGYEQMVACNKVLAGCQAESLNFDNNIWNGERFVDSFTLSWGGQYGEYIP